MITFLSQLEFTDKAESWIFLFYFLQMILTVKNVESSVFS